MNQTCFSLLGCVTSCSDTSRLSSSTDWTGLTAHTGLVQAPEGMGGRGTCLVGEDPGLGAIAAKISDKKCFSTVPVTK